jgi:hypothetical protein
MSYVDLESHLRNIAGSPGKDKEAVDIRLAKERYPQLYGFREGSELFLVSKDFNQFVTDVEIRNNNGQYQAYPFTYDQAVRIYSQPMGFYLGYENSGGFGVKPYLNWETHLETFEIPYKIIRKCRDYLASRQPANYL